MTHALTALLIDVSCQVNAESKHRIEDLLATITDYSLLPLTFSQPPASQSKRPRRASSQHGGGHDDQSTTSADGGEAHVAASVGSNDDTALLQEDILQSDEASRTGFLGRSSQAQSLRALQANIELSGGELSSMVYGPPGSSNEASDERAAAFHERQGKTNQKSAAGGYFTDHYFYLDGTNIDIEIDDPHMVPSANTAKKLLKYYRMVVHSPFQILDDDFEAQVQTYCNSIEDGGTINVSAKWKAMMNLAFAIGVRYSHLIGDQWQAEDRDHLIYTQRAIHFLQFGGMNTLVSQPDQSLIQVSLALTLKSRWEMMTDSLQAIGMLSFYYLIIGHVSRCVKTKK
jgi:hypothetical protein